MSCKLSNLKFAFRWIGFRVLGFSTILDCLYELFSWIYGLSNKFHCDYEPIDRTSETNKEVDKIFASTLKSKLSTNQKEAKKRVEKQNKDDKETAKQVALDANKMEERKNIKALLVPPLVVPIVSSALNYDTNCLTYLIGLPLPRLGWTS